MIALNRRMKLSISFLIMSLVAAMAWSTVTAATSTLTAQGGEASEGQTVSVPIVLSDAPNGVSGFDMTITLSNGSVAGITDASMPSYGLTSVNIISDTEIRIKAADIQDIINNGAVDVTLATLTLQAKKRGGTDIQIAVAALDDDNGGMIAADVVNGSLSVKRAGKGGGSDGGTTGGGGKGGGKGRNK